MIYQDLVRQFWNKALVTKGREYGEDSIESVIHKRKIVISEQIIRKVLQIKDQSGFPIEIYMEQTEEIIKKMGYDGVSPPAIKKLLPPYWHVLAHSFVICISGRKSGADEISLLNIGAIVALAMDLEFNFSRFVLNKMKNNLEGKRKDKFLMYPRFLQMIFDRKYQTWKEVVRLLIKNLWGEHFWAYDAKSHGKVCVSRKVPFGEIYAVCRDQ